MLDVIIRPEREEDHAAVRELVRRAFDSDDEPRIIDALRSVAQPILSLVAELDGEVVGHILFTPVTIRDATPSTAMGLAPMAVAPGHQRSGIGGKLIRAGLAGCRELGEDVVFVLGHSDYYPRFGFEPAGPRGLHWVSEEFDPHFFVTELRPGALGDRTGLVEYHEAFG